MLKTSGGLRALLLGLLLGAGVSACSRSASDSEASAVRSVTAPSADTTAPWVEAPMHPPTPRGMLWIPDGALIAGTAPERLPRKADEEMPGEQVVLDGFFIDAYAYPNEQGAIPETNVTQAEARALCAAQSKRLCSELEWERACKGPDNETYEYGQVYAPARCGTGEVTRPLPAGYRFNCVSAFGVHDMHGGIFEWTDSPWSRGTTNHHATLRGGNGHQGDVIGRCANGLPRDPTEKSTDIGFRCCSGPRNPAEVTLQVAQGLPLRRVARIDRGLGSALEAAVPEKAKKSMARFGTVRTLRLWEWQPLGNEDLVVAGICAGAAPARECGVLLVRRTLGRLDVLDWAPSGFYVPTLKLEHNPRLLWVYGGDKLSHYRRAVSFEWGKVKVGPERRGEN